jgi:cephalosporin hydroxylase
MHRVNARNLWLGFDMGTKPRDIARTVRSIFKDVPAAFGLVYQRMVAPSLHRRFFTELVKKTDNFANVKWLGQPIWQNVLDLWTIQETIFEVKPDLLIECGTNRGGSALFYAQLLDLMERGRVITVDIQKMHEISHPRITFLHGNSISHQVLEEVRSAVRATDRVIMAVLDSDHSASHVSKELEAYSTFVTPGSFLLAQDGVIDTLPVFRGRPGPLQAIREFLSHHPEFEVDVARSERFLITHHPMGWLRRRIPAS